MRTIQFGGAALGLFLCTAVQAQGPGPGPGRRGPRDGAPGAPPLEMLAERLGLSEDQVAQIKALREKNFEANKAVFDAARKAHEAFDKALNTDAPDPATVGQLAIAMRAADRKVEAVHKADREELRSILTPEQFEKLEQGPRGFGPPPGGGPRRPRQGQ